jgi:hypothetical protein
VLEHAHDGPHDRDAQRQIDQRRGDGKGDLEQPGLRHAHEGKARGALAGHDHPVLPQALERAKCPAETLLAQRAQGFGGLGPGHGVLVIGDLPAFALDRDGQVLILGQRVFRVAAHVIERLATPCPHRAGHDHDRVEAGERAALDVLRGHIFDRLPAGDEVDPVADFGIARHRADFRLLEPAHELADGLRLELGIGVEGDDDFPVGSGKGAVERAGLAPLVRVISRTRGSCPKACATMALVRSFEPSSATITSSSG